MQGPANIFCHFRKKMTVIDLKVSRSKLGKDGRKEHSRQEEQHVQRPRGRREARMAKTQTGRSPVTDVAEENDSGTLG